MKLTPEMIKKTISHVAGEDVLPLVEKLKKQDNLSEFILAKEVNYEINIVRNMLYRLYHANLVSFTRKKDKQKGWYIYYWTFRPNKIKDLVDKIDKERLEGLRSRYEREKGKEFYRCPTRCMRFEFMQAMEYDFKCPECGSIMNHEDNSENLGRIQKEIDELQQKIALKKQMREQYEKERALAEKKLASKPAKKIADEKPVKKIEKKASKPAKKIAKPTHKKKAAKRK